MEGLEILQQRESLQFRFYLRYLYQVNTVMSGVDKNLEQEREEGWETNYLQVDATEAHRILETFLYVYHCVDVGQGRDAEEGEHAEDDARLLFVPRSKV